jgi:hypothetical protein
MTMMHNPTPIAPDHSRSGMSTSDSRAFNRSAQALPARIMSRTFSALNGLKFLAIAVVLSLPVVSNAQLISHGDLFGPGAPPALFGIELGFGSHQQQGSFQAICRCEFPQASGTGFLGSLVFEQPLSYEWVVGIKGGIDFKNTVGRTPVVDTATIRFPDPKNGDSVTLGTISFDRIGTIKTTYFSLTPFVQYQFFRLGPFIQAGLGVSFLVANHFTHQRELTSSTAHLADGSTIANLRFENGTMDETLEDGPITGVKSLRLGGLVSAGYDISVNDRAVIAPMITYDFPLTTIRDNLATNWKIATLYGSVELKYKLN